MEQEYNIEQGIKNIEISLNKFCQTLDSHTARIELLEKNDIRIQSRLGIYQIITPSATAVIGSLITYIIFK